VGGGKKTHRQIAILLAILADFLFCYWHRLWGVDRLLGRLWRAARAICLRSDSWGKCVGHGCAGHPSLATRRRGGTKAASNVTVRKARVNTIPDFAARYRIWPTKLLHNTPGLCTFEPIGISIVEQDLITSLDISHCVLRRFGQSGR